ncbi:pilus assembly protein [Vibrio palustris]|uniref:VWFA domain-containing protein n=1 Tax=Vibrio palustris TaxID=1918946 RepID=A0A1R4B1K5_9VIBR|nr:pilus assembly protein [Vibrio palustris]SJL82799.1 hypothetical protein VPAL9027_00739 [Vibrio palustris]
MTRYQRQQGHAAILFALMIPLLFGVFILGTDGARALQDKARLEEASEVAALAIAGQSGGSEQARNKLATDYIQYYFPNAKVDGLKTAVIACENNSSCKQGGSASERFFEYQVAAHIQEPNWFSKASIETSFGDNLNVGGYSSARKYQSKTVDVVLVADFSSSMENSTGDSNNPKYVDLKNVIGGVSDILSEYNEKLTDKSTQSKIAFVGFNRFVPDDAEVSNGNYYADQYTYMFCSGKARYKHTNNDGWCFNDAQRIDYDKTINNIFYPEKFSPVYAHKKVTFYPVNLTSDFKKFKNTIKNFTPEGTTAFYGGLIKGAQIAHQGKNSRRLIIILSDGMNSNKEVTQRMISHGLCNTITQKLNNDVTPSNEAITSRLFAIGVGYRLVNKYPEMSQCVGKNNVYDADDTQEIKNKILELIAEEMGRLSPSNEQ